MINENILGIVAGILTSISMLSQLIKVPIIYSNAFAVLVNLCLLGSYLIYRKKA